MSERDDVVGTGILVAPAGIRVVAAGGLGLAALAATSVVAAWQVAVLTGWDIAAAVFVGWALAAVSRRDSAATKALATRETIPAPPPRSLSSVPA